MTDPTSMPKKAQLVTGITATIFGQPSEGSETYLYPNPQADRKAARLRRQQNAEKARVAYLGTELGSYPPECTAFGEFLAKHSTPPFTPHIKAVEQTGPK
jgi:hypothetical protein